ncbi:MAG: RHS repeat-associated core domain-containing protein [Patescibacteria group bacterium]|nr:RHS repeat-associated core domain-containing protein [Patescibacteria group bacterium]
MVLSENKYLYNGKELQDEQLGSVNLDWYDFNFRMYDPALGRFTCLDPIAEDFYDVSPYNYAENSPIANIDLWGLQKVYFMNSANNNPTFRKAHNLARNTTLGKGFSATLANQKKYDAVYFEIKSGSYSGAHTEKSSLKDAKNTLYPAGFKDPTFKDEFKNLDFFESYFSETSNKKLLLLGVDVAGTETSKENLLETGEGIIHEEQHAKEYLTGTGQNNEEVHEEYFGEKTWSSPTTKEIKTNPKFKDTPAYQTVKELEDEIDKMK